MNTYRKLLTDIPANENEPVTLHWDYLDETGRTRTLTLGFGTTLTTHEHRRIVAVMVDDQRIHLKEQCKRLLELLCSNRGRSVSGTVLLEALYGPGKTPHLKILDVLICQLGKQIGDRAKEPAKRLIRRIADHGRVMRKARGEEVKPMQRPILIPSFQSAYH